MDKETIRNLQGFHEDRKNIVKVKGKLQVARPPRSREERERLERQEREQEREDEREQRESQSRRGGRDNGIEETLCTLRLRENIHDPSRADIYNPKAGRISTLNSHNLPVLRWLQLSAEFGRLQRVMLMKAAINLTNIICFFDILDLINLEVLHVTRRMLFMFHTGIGMHTV